jgi:hypothetical protein
MACSSGVSAGWLSRCCVEGCAHSISAVACPRRCLPLVLKSARSYPQTTIWNAPLPPAVLFPPRPHRSARALLSRSPLPLCRPPSLLPAARHLSAHQRSKLRESRHSFVQHNEAGFFLDKTRPPRARPPAPPGRRTPPARGQWPGRAGCGRREVRGRGPSCWIVLLGCYRAMVIDLAGYGFTCIDFSHVKATGCK